jgi:hypothetical protein
MAQTAGGTTLFKKVKSPKTPAAPRIAPEITE